MADKQAALFESLLQEHRTSWEYTHARASDPDTSHEAASEVAGNLGPKMQRAMDAVGELPGCTAAELDDVHVGNGTIRKRLNDLRIKGLAYKGEKRKCRVTGRNAYTWWPTPR